MSVPAAFLFTSLFSLSFQVIRSELSLNASVGQTLMVKRLKPGLGMSAYRLDNWHNVVDVDKRIEYLSIGSMSQCQGPDSGHYTLIAQYNSDTACNSDSIQYMSETLTFGSNREEKIVNILQALGRGVYVSGTNIDDENLYFVQSGAGSLEGKYVYIKTSWHRDDYMRKCTALTGYSYVSSKRLTIMIADKLDLNVFLSTVGAFEVFKKSAKTICNGHAYLF